jgi:hypothetical protein
MATRRFPDTTIFSLLHAAQVLEDRVEAALVKAGPSTPNSPSTCPGGAGDQWWRSWLRLSCEVNMTQLVDRLEADGLVERVDDLTDRRS